MYQLKKNVQSFTMVEGPLGRKTFSPGETYDQIPPGLESKFETVGGDTLLKKVSPAKLRVVNPDPPKEITEEVS
jgi:hypothetical protein